MARLCHRILPTLLLLLPLTRLGAQELTFLSGNMHAEDQSSYAYQVDYRQYFTRYFAGSVAYMNEGHIVGHHRDGTAFQLWGRLPMFRDRFALAAGVGEYFFYDTQPTPGDGTADVHGHAPVYSLSATYYLGSRWFVRANFNRVEPKDQLRTTSSTIGLGYWFGRELKPTPGKLGDAPDEYKYVTAPELTVFTGQSIVNTFFSETARAYGVEYRQGWAPHVDWTLGGIYEGDPKVVRRSGITLQVWAVNTFFDDRWSVGVGLGPYFYIDHKHPPANTLRDPADVAPLVSFTVARKFADHWLWRLTFNRVTTNYNRDADVILIGLGYRWGS